MFRIQTCDDRVELRYRMSSNVLECSMLKLSESKRWLPDLRCGRILDVPKHPTFAVCESVEWGRLIKLLTKTGGASSYTGHGLQCNAMRCEDDLPHGQIGRRECDPWSSKA